MLKRLGLSFAVILLSGSARAEFFHEDSLDLAGLQAVHTAAGCPTFDPQPEPAPIDDPAAYKAFTDVSAPFCERFPVALRILTLLASEEETDRYNAVRFLFKIADSNHLRTVLNSFSSHDYGVQINRRLTVMAITDLPYIQEYAKKVAKAVNDNSGNMLNFTFTGGDLSHRHVQGWVCAGNDFNDVNLTNATWTFDWVTRRCNFYRVKAPGLRVKGWLISQRYLKSDLQGSRFEFAGSGISEVTFEQSDLRHAVINGDLSQVKFVESDLEGAWLNGKFCTSELSDNGKKQFSCMQ